MADRPAVKESLARLDRALVSLEQAVEERRAQIRSVESLQGDVQRLSKERSDLNRSLEQEKERSGRLEQANEEVSRRLGSAMESVRAVLDQHGG